MDTYGNEIAARLSLPEVLSIFLAKKVERVFVKPLAGNDNSKNQIYLGGDFSAINILPTGRFELVSSSSSRSFNRERQILRANLNLRWLDAEGREHPSDSAKLILYPQFPEVRLSGFVRGTGIDFAGWMDPNRSGRSDGRYLILGTKVDCVFAWLVVPDARAAEDIKIAKAIGRFGALNEIAVARSGNVESREILIQKLWEVHKLGWIPGKRLDRTGIELAYDSPNGGGYTLEAELGIKPNGYSEPDFYGWEVKQYGVSRFDRPQSKAITLMTPEPTGGIYKSEGVIPFVVRYGYPDKSGKLDRLNFGGVYKFGIEHPLTGLTLELDGFDESSRRIVKADGGIVLRDKEGTIAASWQFGGLLEHWKRKHTKAVFVPSMSRRNPKIEYHYSYIVSLGMSTDFSLLLAAVAKGALYLDPAVKVTNVSSEKPESKRRNQFRINSFLLDSLYHQFETVDLRSTTKPRS